MPNTGKVVNHLVVGRGHDFHRMQPGSANNGIVGPKSSTTENKTYWTTGPALTGRATSPIVIVVAPLKPDKILPAEIDLSKERFICLEAGSCNRSVVLPWSTSTLCTSKLLIHKVSTSAS